ncbi:hypothetical protein OsI_07607 [Oryza sativa Indica Group]|uniref:Uncharacterized protein n=1 Tax=Oryza sativa subsp. indica TaxID=39946 RepID=B8AJD4_ORYSI|nr:hypothetical protein OsI_07607 [Oryza sativa Indica Group]
MQYHQHRSRLPPPPPPPPFGRGGGGAGYPRGHKQLYAPPPPPPPQHQQQRRYEVLMEAGRLAAEYLVAKGVLPPSSLQRGVGAWGAPSPPPPPAAAGAAPPPPQQQREDPAFYGRRRYDDEYSNNSSARPRRNSSNSSSSSSSRDDYSGGSYNGRGKRKYGDYRRGYSDWGRDREKERGRPGSNGRRYDENDDEDGAPGFRRERRGSGGNDDARSSVADVYREATPLMRKELGDLEMNGTESRAANPSGEVKEADAPQMVQSEENEEGEMEEDGMVLNSEPEVVELRMDTNDDVNNASVGVDMETELQRSPNGNVPGEKAEDDDKVLVESALDSIALDDEVANTENNLHGDERNLLKYCEYAKAPTKRRSSRPQRNAASVQIEPAVSETTDQISIGEASQIVPGEVANEISVTNLKSENREDQIYRENTDFSTSCNGTLEPILLEENNESAATGNIIEEKNDVQLHVVKKPEEEGNVSAFVPSHKDSLMQETDLSPSTASHKDSLLEGNLPLLTDSHNSLIEETGPPLTHSHEDSMVEETNLSSLTTSHKGNLKQETDLSQTISSHENNLKLQFKESCGIDMLPQDVDLIELSGQRKSVGGELFSNVGAEAASKMEDKNLEQPNPFKICDQNLIGSSEVSVIHNNPGLAQCSTEGSCTESQKNQHQDFVTTSGDIVGSTNNMCQLPLDNKGVQVIDIEDDTPIEVGGFDSSKAKSDMICSNMDNMMGPVVHSGDLPGIQDGYNLAISDYLGGDIPCYPSMQSDLHGGIGANDSEGITVMDDPIYGSLTDIGFMDVWGQPTQDDYEKFF